MPLPYLAVKFLSYKFPIPINPKDSANVDENSDLMGFNTTNNDHNYLITKGSKLYHNTIRLIYCSIDCNVSESQNFLKKIQKIIYIKKSFFLKIL